MRRMIQKVATIVLSGVLAAALVMFPASGATAKNWADGTANWSPGMWSPAGPPVGGEAVNIVFTDGTPRTVTYNLSALAAGLLTVDLTGPGTGASALSMPNAGTLSANGIVIGGYSGITLALTAGRGAFTQSAGTTTVNSGWDFTLGYGANSTGTYTLSGTGALTANQSEYVGLYGSGTFNHSAGTNTIATATGFFDIGTYAGSSGTYNLSGTGTLTVKTNEYVGDIGAGTFNQSDATTHTITNGGSLLVGYNPSGAGGTFTLNAGDLSTASGSTGGEYIGYGGSGTFTQNGGTNFSNASGGLHIGMLAGSNGVYTQTAGSAGSNGGQYIGDAGIGTYTQSGGDNGTGSGSNVFIGNATGSSGTYNLSGTGTLNAAHDLYVGYNGSGTFNQNGGAVSVFESFLMGYSAGSTGTYNLAAGSFQGANFSTYVARVGFNGTATFNQSGGTSNFGASGVVLGDGTGSGTFIVSGGSATTTALTVYNGALTVSDTGVLTVGGFLFLINNSGHLANLNGGTINVAGLDFDGFPGLFNWTSGKLNLTNSVTWDSASYYHSTAAAFGAARALGSNQTLGITGDEGLGGIGSFALTLNAGSAHTVTGTLTINPTGTITQNAGSTLSAGAIVQAGGSVNGTLQNQTTFTYQSGLFNGRLLNQGTASLGPSFSAGNGVENDASMTISLGQTLTANGLGLDNQGNFAITGGTLNGDGPLANNSVLTGRGTLSGAGGFVNNGYVVVNGGTLALSNTGFNSNGGQVDLPGGQQLQLAGATLTNTGLINLTGGTVGGTATLNNTTGIISGHGTITSPLTNAGLLAVDSGILSVTSAFSNSGEIYLAGGVATLSGSGTLTNAALLRGDGVVNKQVNNNVLGEIRAESGKRIKLTGVNGSNVGLINLQGGTAEFSQALFNAGTGQIVGRGTLKVGGTGLQNNGNIALSGGITDIFGDVNNSSGSATKGITFSGNANVTFWDDVTNGIGSLFKVSSGSSATFFGTYGGAGISGTGNVYFESDITPGFSPATVEFGGNVSLASTANLIMELGGTTPGAAYDQVHVSGQLTLDGTLHVALINLGGGLFAPARGQSFDILDWGSRSGTFSAISLPTLAGGLAWNTSLLYTAGVLSVGLPGDFNNNGVVDAADYAVWRKGLGTIYSQNDYNVWRANFGQPGGGGAGAIANAAVPEPTTLVLMMFAAIGWCLRRGRAA